jgi:hypothetical protein
LTAPLVNAQTLLFQDTFDTSPPDETLVNDDLASRQSGSLVTANGAPFDYDIDLTRTAGADASIQLSAVGGSDDGINVVDAGYVFTRDGTAGTPLFGRRMASAIAGGIYDIEIDVTSSLTNNEWMGFAWSEGGNRNVTSNLTDVGIIFRSSEGTSGASTVFVDGSSDGNFSLTDTPNSANVRLRIDETTNSYSIFLDGASTAAISGTFTGFGGNTTRNFTVMTIGGENPAQTTFDNISITQIPEPGFAALYLGVLAVGLAVFRRRPRRSVKA